MLPLLQRPPRRGYEPLSHINNDLLYHVRRACERGIRPRPRFALTVATISSLVFIALARITIYSWSNLPDYKDIKLSELGLPQHNLDLPFPEGINGRYVKFGARVTGKGWNNALEDMVMLAQTSYMARRSYVFPSYTYAPNPFTPVIIDSHFKPRSATIPLTALLDGPIAGGALPDDDSRTRPRSISEAWWEVVCPLSRRVYLNVEDVTKDLDRQYGARLTGKDLLEAWAVKLADIPGSCIEVQGPHIWSFGDEGSQDLISVWDHLESSPILRNFSWSPLVKQMVYLNLPLLLTGSDLPTLPDNTPIVPETIGGLLAIHLRRGDFREHCIYLEQAKFGFAVWNTFQEYPDTFGVPPNPVGRHDMYQRRCFPNEQQVVARIAQVREDRPTLKRIYIMTNAEEDFLGQVTNALRMDGWMAVDSTRSLKIPKEGKEVDMAVDMLIGERAEVFLGNGFSTLSSNVNMVRKARLKAPETTRFW